MSIFDDTFIQVASMEPSSGSGGPNEKLDLFKNQVTE